VLSRAAAQSGLHCLTLPFLNLCSQGTEVLNLCLQILNTWTRQWKNRVSGKEIILPPWAHGRSKALPATPGNLLTTIQRGGAMARTRATLEGISRTWLQDPDTVLIGGCLPSGRKAQLTVA
jgi:hypothetical protein